MDTSMSAHASLGAHTSADTSFGAHTSAHMSLGEHMSSCMCAFLGPGAYLLNLAHMWPIILLCWAECWACYKTFLLVSQQQESAWGETSILLSKYDLETLCSEMMCFITNLLDENTSCLARKNAKVRKVCIFTESAPLDRFSHRVAMSVCVPVCLSAQSVAVFFRPLIGPEITWSVLSTKKIRE